MWLTSWIWCTSVGQCSLWGCCVDEAINIIEYFPLPCPAADVDKYHRLVGAVTGPPCLCKATQGLSLLIWRQQASSSWRDWSNMANYMVMRKVSWEARTQTSGWHDSLWWGSPDLIASTEDNVVELPTCISHQTKTILCMSVWSSVLHMIRHDRNMILIRQLWYLSYYKPWWILVLNM